MITVWNYKEELEKEKEHIDAAISRVFDSGRLLFGKELENFELEFASYIGCRHGVGVANATDGLILALRALKIGQGDEVITVSNTAVPTVSAIIAVGATPVFVDVNEGDLLMRTEDLASSISYKTKCIIPVHLFGQSVDMDAVMSFASVHKLKVIEDCSQAHGAKFKNQRVGGFGDLSVFSFYPTKILGGYGDAGMILTNSDAYNDSLRRLRFYGMESQYYSVQSEGYNSRMDEIHAAILRFKLTQLDSYVLRRRNIARIYSEKLDPKKFVILNENHSCYHSYYLFVIKTNKRDEFLEYLKAKDIYVNISYPWPIHTMSGFKDKFVARVPLLNTEVAAKQIISLPMYPSLSLASVERVCEVANEFS